MNKNQTQLSTTGRIALIALGLLLLQLNVPVCTAFHSSWSAEYSINRPTRTWQNLKLLLGSINADALAVADDYQMLAQKYKPELEPAKTFKIVKVKSKKTVSKFMAWPVNGQISSAFGMRRHPVTTLRSFHNGIDIKARRGTKIVAPAAGIVVTAGRAGLLGRMVKIKTYSGKYLYFGHLQKISCKKGDKIKCGQIIGTVGASGRATGPHLHFSIKSSGKYLNPIKYLARR